MRTPGPDSRPQSPARRAFLTAGLALVSTSVAGACRKDPPFPPQNTPEGAYARIAVAVYDARWADVFPYLEDEAQWAAHTIQKQRQIALEAAKRSFPPAELAAVDAEIGADARAPDGVDVFVRIAKKKGWFNLLRKDLSGVASVEGEDDRRTLVTARGTRYTLRRRKGGIWGLTAFTADLVDAAERATRDRARIEDAAKDYDAAKPAGSAGAPG